MDTTTRLGLKKPDPDPETGDFVNVQDLNENADKVDSAISATVCTSSTRPATPFQGQIIYETDTGRLYVWTGSAWIGIVQQGGGSRTFPSFADFEAATETGIVTGRVTGDSIVRYVLFSSGRMEWGPGGAGSRDTNLYRAGANLLRTDDSFQAAGALNSHLAAVKGGNTTRASNTTITDDPDLSVAVDVNATYIMEAQIIYYAAATVDLMAQFSVPSGASMEWSSFAPSEAHSGSPSYEGVVKFESRNQGQSQSWGGTGVIVHARPQGVLQTAGSAGNIRFRWAQRVSNADASIVYSKSYLRLHRVA